MPGKFHKAGVWHFFSVYGDVLPYQMDMVWHNDEAVNFYLFYEMNKGCLKQLVYIFPVAEGVPSLVWLLCKSIFRLIPYFEYRNYLKYEYVVKYRCCLWDTDNGVDYIRMFVNSRSDDAVKSADQKLLL